MKGVWPNHYVDNPNPENSIEKVWDTLDGYSFEEIYSEGETLKKSSQLTVCIPPVKFGSYFIKGFAYSQISEYLLHKVPNIQKLFHICSNSMTFSYPWSKGVDCCFALYLNKKKEAYAKKKYPHLRDIPFIPLQDADWTNERYIHPFHTNLPKVIDLFCLASLFPVKNIPMIAQMLLVYEKKYHKRLHFVLGMGSRTVKCLKDGQIDPNTLTPYEQSEFKKLLSILGDDIFSYIRFMPHIPYADLTKFLGMSKCTVLASICEGKNRFVHESMSANTPVVVFKDYNKFIRGRTPAIFSNCGEYAKEFTPESLADAVHKVITNQEKYTPRAGYLAKSGRTNFIKTIVNILPYYQNKVLNLKDGDLIHNKFFNRLMKFNYGITLEEFIYDKEPMLAGAMGIDGILEVLKGYMGQFKLPWIDVDDKDIHLFEHK